MTLGKTPKPPGSKLGHRKTPVAAPIRSGAVKPNWLSPVAAQYWSELAPQLEESGVLAKLDSLALSLLVESFASWRTALAAIEREGATVIGSAGTPVLSPYQRVASTSFDQMTKLLVQFGLTPSSRRNVIAAPPEEHNPFSEFVT